MEMVKDLFRHKGYKPVYSVQPNDNVETALKLMADYDLGAILVMENDQIVGIFSERDNARKTNIREHAPKTTLIKDVMVTQVIYVTPDYSLEECLAIMNNKKISHLPVLENDKVITVIGMQEISGTLIQDQDFMIGELTKYITGDYIYEKEKINNVSELVLKPQALVQYDKEKKIYLHSQSEEKLN